METKKKLNDGDCSRSNTACGFLNSIFILYSTLKTVHRGDILLLNWKLCFLFLSIVVFQLIERVKFLRENSGMMGIRFKIIR